MSNWQDDLREALEKVFDNGEAKEVLAEELAAGLTFNFTDNTTPDEAEEAIRYAITAGRRTLSDGEREMMKNFREGK